MRRILALMAGILATAGLLTSCLESDEVVLSSNAYIASFSIDDIKTEIPSKTASGKDTTIVKTVYGSKYTFAIDHVAGEVYNVDSLPAGTDVTRVLVNMTFDGGYVSYYQDNETKIYTSEDSIDFTLPVRFTVYSADGSGSRNYNIRLNVHQADADSLVWTRVEDNKFHGGRMTAEKIVQVLDYLMVFGEMDGVPTMMGGKIEFPFNYAKKEWPLMGLHSQAQVDYSSIVSHKNALYLLADGKLYSSISGVEWIAEAKERTFTAILGEADGKLYLSQADTIVACNTYDWTLVDEVDTLIRDWEVVQAVDESLLPVNPSMVTLPLRTNSQIMRTTLIGAPRVANGGGAVSVWTKLSTDDKWTYYNPVAGNPYACPVLDRLMVIGHNNRLYAFGGASRSGDIAPFEALYASSDGGITWWKQSTKMGFPEELKGYDEPFACVKDTEGRIWLQCSDGRLFCGSLEK